MSQEARDAHSGDILVVDDTVANLRLSLNLSGFVAVQSRL